MKINREKLNYLGGGTEKEVYENPVNPEQALGIYHDYRDESSSLIKARFYLTKILHLLSPENIPDVHLVSSDPKIIVVDRVYGEDLAEMELETASEIRRELNRKLSALGVEIHDDTYGNYKYDVKNKKSAYVDNLYPWANWEASMDSFEGELPKLFYDEKKLEESLQNLKDKDKRDLGLSYLKRLEILREEEFMNLQKKKRNQK